MTAYEELLEFGGERIFDFLKNARLHESQFKYSEFNEVCYKKMYIENNQDSIKTVKELKEEIPELKDTCKGCGSYFMNPRNKSIKGLDVQFEVVIASDKHRYNSNEGEVVNNMYEKLTVKLPKEMDVPMNVEVKLINPEASIYGEYRNQLSIVAEDVQVVSK